MMWNPEDYAKNSDAQLKWARELRENLELQGNESVLDVGCGDGKITADFSVSLPNGRLVGVDKEYTLWLKEAGFKVKHLELVPKDMTHGGKEGLAGWIRITWMPFTHRVPERERDGFITHFVDTYLERIPLDKDGLAHVRMVRLEVNALKP